VGADLPTVEVRFKDLDVRTSVYLGNRALPTLLNSYRNAIEVSYLSRVSIEARIVLVFSLHGRAVRPAWLSKGAQYARLVPHDLSSDSAKHM
jgi:hypothetical protein